MMALSGSLIRFRVKTTRKVTSKQDNQQGQQHKVRGRFCRKGIQVIQRHTHQQGTQYLVTLRVGMAGCSITGGFIEYGLPDQEMPDPWLVLVDPALGYIPHNQVGSLRTGKAGIQVSMT